MSRELSRGDRLKLEKTGGGILTSIEVLIDATAASELLAGVEPTCVFLDGSKSVIDVIYPGRDSKDGSVRCADGKLSINLAAVPASVQYLAIAACHKTEGLSKVCLRVQDNAGSELCQATAYATKLGGIVMAKLFRHNAEWKIEPLGVPADARAPLALVQTVKASW